MKTPTRSDAVDQQQSDSDKSEGNLTKEKQILHDLTQATDKYEAAIFLQPELNRPATSRTKKQHSPGTPQDTVPTMRQTKRNKTNDFGGGTFWNRPTAPKRKPKDCQDQYLMPVSL